MCSSIKLFCNNQLTFFPTKLRVGSKRDIKLYTLKKTKDSLQACNVLRSKFEYFRFYRTVMDGVDLDIEIGSHKYYPDFVREMRRLMNTDKSKQYLITAAPQCPFPDKWMGPQIQGSALEGVYTINHYIHSSIHPSMHSSNHSTIRLSVCPSVPPSTNRPDRSSNCLFD